MKGIVIILLVALVAAEKFPARNQKPQAKTQNPEPEPEFPAGKTLIYNYSVTFESGVEDQGYGKALLRLATDAVITPGPSEHMIQFRNMRLQDAVGYHPKSSLSDPRREFKQLLDCQKFIVYVTYNGRFGSIRISKNADPLCRNVYKGFMYLFVYTARYQREFEVLEEGLEGECNTRYVFYEEKKNDGYMIHKFRDLNNCKQKVMLNVGIPYLQLFKPLNCLQREKFVQGASAIVTKVKRDGNGDLITQAKAEQIYDFPLDGEGSTGYMKAEQLLFLREQQQQQQQGELEATTIRYEISKTLFLPVLDNLNRDPVQQAEELLQDSVRWQFQDKIVSTKIIVLVRLIQRVSYNDLNTLYNKFSRLPVARRVLLISCGHVGNLITVKFIKDKVVSGELTYYDMIWLLPTTFHFANTDINRMEETARVTAEILAKIPDKTSILGKMAYLAYGSMVNKQCSTSRTCHPKLLEPLHNLLVEAIREKEENKIVLALKAIANAGQIISLKQVKLLCESPKYPERIQVTAVQTLGQISQQDPTKVQGFLLQIFMDVSRCEAVRIMASIVLLDSAPPLPIVIAMAHAMLYEENVHIVSFVYSHFKSITKILDPMHYTLASYCSTALRILSPRFDELTSPFNKALYFIFYNSLLNNGVTLKFFMSGDNRYPSTIIWKADATFFHTSAELLEIALQVQGMDKLFEQSVSQSEQHSTKQKIKDTQEKFPSYQEVPDKELSLGLSVKILGNHIMYLDFSEMYQHLKVEEYRPAVIKVWMKCIEMFFKFVNVEMNHHFVLDMGQVLPTAPGLPFQINLNGLLGANVIWKGKDGNHHNSK
ncbi:vitellogenin-2 [Protobothrops mucrosquamatus]|uniref:vitellogenin-2 n=1 Tax=Protobothrops mucrosquamatus TaxID=103944 RepID=UPI000775CFF6|nr:vitellogenin-2 [Protobothrops mucrosquamatus]